MMYIFGYFEKRNRKRKTPFIYLPGFRLRFTQEVYSRSIFENGFHFQGVWSNKIVQKTTKIVPEQCSLRELISALIWQNKSISSLMNSFGWLFLWNIWNKSGRKGLQKGYSLSNIHPMKGSCLTGFYIVSSIFLWVMFMSIYGTNPQIFKLLVDF